MTDITYQAGTSETAAHGTNDLATFAAWCCQVAEGAREGQPIAARYHKLSRLSGPALASPGH